jgi:site-specific recombinase
MDHKRNEDVKKQLRTKFILSIISKYKANWIQPVGRRQRNRLLEVLKRSCNVHGCTNQGETSGIRPEPVTKWPNFRTATLMEAADG